MKVDTWVRIMGCLYIFGIVSIGAMIGAVLTSVIGFDAFEKVFLVACLFFAGARIIMMPCGVEPEDNVVWDKETQKRQKHDSQ